jgi:hypothetical protein
MPNPNQAHNFAWDVVTQRYRDARSGQFASQRTVTMLLNRQITVAQKETRSLGQQLLDKKIDVTQWRDATRVQLKVIHATQAAKAVGSFDQMTQVEWGRVGGKLKFQFDRLENLANEVATGKQSLDGRFTQRVNMYAEAGRGTFAATEAETKQDSGKTEYRNILHPAEHCQGCLDETAKGWVRIGGLVPIGQRQCRVNDKCSYEYR